MSRVSWKQICAWWDSKHVGNIFIVRTREGWVVSLLHSEGITGPSEFLVPFRAANGQSRRQLAGRLRRLLVSTILDLGNVRRASGREVEAELRMPGPEPAPRKGERSAPAHPGNWNGRGRLAPTRGMSGLSYLAARTERGWLVVLRSLWGAPCGSYHVPFDKSPFSGSRWDADFFVRPLRWHLTHMQGARTLNHDEVARLRARHEDDMVDDLKAA